MARKPRRIERFGLPAGADARAYAAALGKEWLFYIGVVGLVFTLSGIGLPRPSVGAFIVTRSISAP
jgi:hypothetical protein